MQLVFGYNVPGLAYRTRFSRQECVGQRFDMPSIHALPREVQEARRRYGVGPSIGDQPPRRWIIARGPLLSHPPDSK